MKAREIDKAVENYRKAIRINPNFADAHNNLGNALRDLAMGNPDLLQSPLIAMKRQSL